MAIAGFDIEHKAPENLEKKVSGTTDALEGTMQIFIMGCIEIPSAAFRALFNI